MSSGRGKRRRGAGAKRRAQARAQSFDADVLELTPTGDAVAVLDDGRRVFVSGVVAGERVRLRLEPGSRTLRGRVDEVLSASPQRVEPPCLHAGRCGGCDWMHVAESERRASYGAMLTALVEHAGISDVAAPALHTPLPALAYRSRARFSLRAHGQQVQVGYRAARSHRLAEVDRCVVLRDELAPVIAQLGALLSGSDGTGEALVAIGRGDRPVVELRWQGELDASVFARASELVSSAEWAGTNLWPQDATMPASFGDPEPIALAADGQPLSIAPGGFAQASDEGSVALASRVAELVRVEKGKPRSKRIVELFAGSGTLTVMLVALAEQYIAVEQHGPALNALRKNLAARSLSAKVLSEDANDFTIPKPTECVVLDPPRAGAAGAMDRIAAVRPRRVVYVSCNPVTLARDLAKLADSGYAIDRLEQFELFPQTSHVETIARLIRR